MRNLEIAPYISKHLGVPGGYGAWWTARRLLQQIWIEEKHKPEIIRDAEFDLRDLPFRKAGKHLLWRREITASMVGWYIHHVDKNSQYLSADRGMYTGVGTPIHVDGEPVAILPGIYHVTFTMGTSLFDGTNYPYIIQPGQEWVTKEVLIFARKNGYTVEVVEAWVFPEYARVLDEWAARIWAGRVALKGVNDAAYNFMKEIATVGNGSWDTGKDKHEGIDLIHPNWWADTVGKARTALLANLLKYGSPILIETDGLYFVTRNPDPRTAILNDEGVTILARENESGGYKYEASCLITQELYEAAKGLKPGQLANLIKETCNNA